MPRYYAAVVASVLATLILGAGGSLLGPLLPIIANEFHIPMEVCSLLLGVTFAGAVCSVLIGGYLADLFGKKILFFITITGLAISYLLLIFAPSFAFIAIALLVIGALGVTIEGLSSSVIADIDPARVERNINLLQVAFSTGAVLSLTIASAMLHVHSENWRMPYGVISVAAGAVLLLSLLMRVPASSPGETINLSIARSIIKDRNILLLTVAIALYVGSEMSLAWWISPILEIQYRYPVWVSVLAAGLFWLTVGIGRVVSGILCNRYPGYSVLKGLLVCGLLSYVILLLPLGQWRLWAGVAAAGFSFSGIWPLIVGLGGARYPQYSGTTISVLVAGGTVGGMIFPALIGYIVNSAHLPMSWGLYFMASLFAALSLLIWANAPSSQRTDL